MYVARYFWLNITWTSLRILHQQIFSVKKQTWKMLILRLFRFKKPQNLHFSNSLHFRIERILQIMLQQLDRQQFYLIILNKNSSPESVFSRSFSSSFSLSLLKCSSLISFAYFASFLHAISQFYLCVPPMNLASV